MMNETWHQDVTKLPPGSEAWENSSTNDGILTTPEDGLQLPPANEMYLEDMTMSLIYYGVGTVGIIGNLMVIAVFLSSTEIRRKITNMLIIHQSVLDMSASIFLILHTLIDEMSWVPKGLASELFCRYALTIRVYRISCDPTWKNLNIRN